MERTKRSVLSAWKNRRMARGMNWDKVHRDRLMQRPYSGPRMTRKQPGITPAQAKYLASLQRELGEPYTGNGMRRAEASQAIDRCLTRLGRSHKHAA